MEHVRVYNSLFWKEIIMILINADPSDICQWNHVCTCILYMSYKNARGHGGGRGRGVSGTAGEARRGEAAERRGRWRDAAGDARIYLSVSGGVCSRPSASRRRNRGSRCRAGKSWADVVFIFIFIYNNNNNNFENKRFLFNSTQFISYTPSIFRIFRAHFTSAEEAKCDFETASSWASEPQRGRHRSPSWCGRELWQRCRVKSRESEPNLINN